MPRISEGQLALGGLTVFAIWLFFVLPLLPAFASTDHSFLQNFPTSREFWSGLIGTVVGGLISAITAYLIQTRAFREARQQREQDRLADNQALARSLLFKMIQIHSNLGAVNTAVAASFAKAAKEGVVGEPWAIFVAPANVFDPVDFSTDEMGMLLGLKDDDVFNKVAGMDSKHNSVAKVLTVLAAERKALGERLTVEGADGNKVSGKLDRATYLALRPKMIEVNDLVEIIMRDGKELASESAIILDALNALLRRRLDLKYTLVPRSA